MNAICKVLKENYGRNLGWCSFEDESIHFFLEENDPEGDVHVAFLLPEVWKELDVYDVFLSVDMQVKHRFR